MRFLRPLGGSSQSPVPQPPSSEVSSAQPATARPSNRPSDRPERWRRRAGRRWLPAAALALVAACVAVGLQLPAGAHDAAPAGYRQSDLRRDTDAIRALGVTGVQARVTTDVGRELVATSGVAEVGTGRPVPPDGYFRMASTGKALVATVVLQLVDEGGLALDDTVDDWLPGLVEGNGNDGREITVRQLLQHTSGIRDDLPGFDTPREYHERRYETFTAQQIVARAMAHPPDFPPGAGWGYANTGYVLLDLIIEQVTGRPWHEEVEDRVLRPLGMDHTYLPGGDPTLRRPHAHAYQVFPTGERVDVTKVIIPDPGGYVSTTADVNRFFLGLLGGELLSPARLAEMRDTVPVNEEMRVFWPDGRYGLGLVDRPLSCGGRYVSHEGGEAGYITLNGVTEDGGRAVTVSMSTALGDSPDAVLRQERAASDLVDRALCGGPDDGRGA
ncbi:serine hydrolase domain-containing protein [Streptomyces sp. DSM 44915]|uniref:Serine hydrolase domain-containing protein n=1 Tax=Streptomyces chisholmiae TaxID=3075540 RepID=A0ABU2JZI1_9ACTN|nr:serine hydrolase domain-containing protein [Streptomyces sp. DSM 44915]MDT0270406.1 serine hydrolase domain-containing protein [Streptomyces sp. DSM 44915]